MQENKKPRELSPAARHRERVLSEKRTQSVDENSQSASEYELKLRELAQDKRDLSNIKGIDLKIAKKTELLPKYLPWVEGVIAGDSGVQDDVLVTMMVWSIDIGNTDMALQLSEYAIKHKLAKPDTYQRDIPNIIAEEIADAQIKLRTLEQPLQPEVLQRTLALTQECDLFDEVRAKLHKAMGYALLASDKPAALEQFKKALSLHEKVGVKKDIETLERDIRNSAAAGNGSA